MDRTSSFGVHLLRSLVLLAFLTLLVNVTPRMAQVESSVKASDASPSKGDIITATIDFDMTGVSSPDNNLGSFTGTLDWDPAVLDYQSNGRLQNVRFSQPFALSSEI